MQASLHEIANLVQGTLVGDKNLTVKMLSPIDNIEEQALVFAEGADNLKRAEESKAAVILVAKHVTCITKPFIQVPHPFKAFIKLLSHFYPEYRAKPHIHPTAIIGAAVTLGKNLFIGPYVVVEDGCSIGDNCVIKSHVHLGRDVTIGTNTTLHPQVTIYARCIVGARVTIHASTVIGSDGFGYLFEDGQHLKVPHIGHVRIEDDVEIGANTVIDRATLGATVIGAGTKIDNLVQVAHSVKLGQHNILCAFTGIAGSTTSGNNVIFAANTGVGDHVTIDDGVILGARAGVPSKKHLKHGNIYLGNPARPKEKAIEQELATTRIPFIRKNLKMLTDKVTLIAERLECLDKEVE